jgi:hypothetical protein
MAHREKEKWLRDVDARQRNVVFPNTPIDVALLLFAGAVSRIGKRAGSLALAVILLGCSQAAHKNVCPIDGQPPQWSGARDGQSCEYFHYSNIEKKTHSWWSACSTPQ